VWRVTIKGLVAHKFRLALTSIAVVLGVTFMAGAFVLTDTIGGVFEDLFGSALKGVAVAVRSRAQLSSPGPGNGIGTGREPVPASLVSVVGGVRGVKNTAGSYSAEYAQFIDRHGKPITNGRAPNFGGAWVEAPGLNHGYRLRHGGKPPRSGTQLAMDAGTAKRYHYKVGDRVKVAFSAVPAREFTISGIFDLASSDVSVGATFAAFDTETAQQVLGRPGHFDVIYASSDPGVSQTELRNRVARKLPRSLEVITGKQLTDQTVSDIKKTIGFFNTFLLVFAFVALFVGAFIIYNTFSIIVSQRARELALIRALGASGAQVTSSVAAEAIATGVVSSAFGVLAGIGLAIGVQALLKTIGFTLPSGATKVLPRTVIVSMIMGSVITFVSALAPARRAARVPPVAAMRDLATTPSSGKKRFVIGAIFTVVGVVLLGVGLFGHVKSRDVPGGAAGVVGAAGFFVVLGVAMLSALAARPLARVLGAGPARYDGISGQLARENAMRNPRRTASTAAALMIGLALISLVTIFGSSAKESLNRVLNETIASDFFLTTENRTGFSREVVARLNRQPATAEAVGFRFGPWKLKDETKFLIAVAPDHLEQNIGLKMQSGSVAGLRDGGLLIFKDVAKEHHWKVGDTVEMRFAKNNLVPVPIVIDGVYGENRAVGSNYVLSQHDFERNFTDQFDVFAGVRTPPGFTHGETRAAIKNVLRDFPNVKAQDQSEFKRAQEASFNAFLNFTLVLLLFSVLIAVLGIINTMALSLFERTRELGLLRAVGMSRPQTRIMVRWEAAIVSVFGALLGLAIGVVFGRAIVLALANQGVTFALPQSSLFAIVVLAVVAVLFARLNFWPAAGGAVVAGVVYFVGLAFGLGDLRVPGGQLLALALLAGIAGLAAAAWPSWRATKLDVLDAIATE